MLWLRFARFVPFLFGRIAPVAVAADAASFLLLSLSLVCIRLSADMLYMMMLMMMMVAMMLYAMFAWIWMCLLCFVLPLTSFSADLFLFVQQSAASLLHACFCRFAFCFLFLFHTLFYWSIVDFALVGLYLVFRSVRFGLTYCFWWFGILSFGVITSFVCAST